MSLESKLWLASRPLLLASGSATRRNMLLASGVPVETVSPEVDERAIEAPLQEQGATASTIALTLARAKALAVSQRHPGRTVLGADQTLTCDGTAFHKPSNRAEAESQIAALSGRTHELHAALVLVRDGVVLVEDLGSTRLSMRPLSPAFIASYLDTVGATTLASVGGYQIEGPGAQLFASIDGDHFTILGLPLFAVLAALRDLDLLAR